MVLQKILFSLGLGNSFTEKKKNKSCLSTWMLTMIQMTANKKSWQTLQMQGQWKCFFFCVLYLTLKDALKWRKPHEKVIYKHIVRKWMGLCFMNIFSCVHILSNLFKITQILSYIVQYMLLYTVFWHITVHS